LSWREQQADENNIPEGDSQNGRGVGRRRWTAIERWMQEGSRLTRTGSPRGCQCVESRPQESEQDALDGFHLIFGMLNFEQLRDINVSDA
jgi:hypothetical protein